MEVKVRKMFWPHLILAEVLVVAPIATVNGWLGFLAFWAVLAAIEIAYGLLDWFFGID